MTSIILRRSRKRIVSDFPCTLAYRRLRQVKETKELGTFHLDMVDIVLKVKWRIEDIRGVSTVKPVLVKDKETKKFLGKLYSGEFESKKFKIFIGRGRIRVIKINPRRFSSYSEFEAFAEKIIDGRPYHISHVHFSWRLKKDFFSVAYLWWVLWVKGLHLHQKYLFPAKHKNGPLVDRGSFSSFRYGSNPKSVTVYDCDSYNTVSKREEAFKTHNRINFEIQVGRKILEKNGIRKLKDLRSIRHFSWMLKGIEFVRPQNRCFRGPLTGIQERWEIEGASSMARELYKATRRDYSVVEAYVDRLRTKNFSLKRALLILARDDFRRFVRGDSMSHRTKTVRSVLYDLKPLFVLSR